MALAIRLRQQGRKNHAFYRVVVMDERSRRDGKYLEALGWYNPYETKEELELSINADRIQHWLNVGAQMTQSVANLVQRAAPSLIRWKTERTLAQTAKRREKRKAKKETAKS